MKWSWKLGTGAGIGLYVHGTFLLLVASIRLPHLLRGRATPAIARVGIILAVFYLLPAVPRDGGRGLRAFLALGMDYTRATQVAAHVGQALAFAFGLVGLFTNPFLVFIAFFVWIGAAQEASMVQMRAALAGIPVSRATLKEFHTLSPHDPATRVLELIRAASQQDFPVVEHDRVVGELLRSDVLNALAQRRSEWQVSDVMRREFEVVDAGDMLDTAFAPLQACACPPLPVTSRGVLGGQLTMANLGQVLRIQSAVARVRQ